MMVSAWPSSSFSHSRATRSGHSEAHLYTVQCTVYRTMYSVQCTVQCTVYSVQLVLLPEQGDTVGALGGPPALQAALVHCRAVYWKTLQCGAVEVCQRFSSLARRARTARNSSSALAGFSLAISANTRAAKRSRIKASIRTAVSDCRCLTSVLIVSAIPWP